MSTLLKALVSAGAFALTAPAFAQAAATGAAPSFSSLRGNPAAGERVFAQCRACHVTDKGVNRVGPSLHGIVGRKSGSVPGFRYSKANQSANIVWTEENLFKYLENPRQFIPGTTMAFAGIRNPQQRADLIAYLRQFR